MEKKLKLHKKNQERSIIQPLSTILTILYNGIVQMKLAHIPSYSISDFIMD